MEFYLEQEALERDLPVDPNVEKDEKTNKLFSDLEEGLNQIYDKTTGEIKKVLNDEKGSEYIKLELPISEKSSEKAQQILSTLDSNLASIESTASSYWNKVKKPTFWSSLTEDVGSKLGTVVATASKGVSDIINSTSSGRANPVELKKGEVQEEQRLALAGNRTEAELKELATDKNFYFKALERKSFKEMDVSAKTEEINELLKQDNDLQKLMSEIVPQDISYENFWSIYFSGREEILEKEKQRKALLDKTTGKEEQEEEVGWDDDDEEEGGSNEPAQMKKSTENKSSNDLESSNAKDGMKNKEEVKQEEEEDDDDDKWE